jgi:hypothetical protein
MRIDLFSTRPGSPSRDCIGHRLGTADLIARIDDEERALGAVPKLLGENNPVRATLGVLYRVLAAPGDLSDERKRRLARVETLFGTLPAKAVRAETEDA